HGAAVSTSVELPVTARLSELGPKINRLSRLIEAFLCWRSEAIESTRRNNRSTNCASRGSMLDCLRRWMSASISDGSVFGMSSRLAILGCLGRSLGQALTSAKSESDWIHFCHAAPPKGDSRTMCFSKDSLDFSFTRRLPNRWQHLLPGY